MQLRAASPTSALAGSDTLTELPDDNSQVKVEFEGKTYTLLTYENPSIKTNPDIRVSGGEPGRIEAILTAIIGCRL